MWTVFVYWIGFPRETLHKATEPLVEVAALSLTPALALERVDKIGTGLGESRGHLTSPFAGTGRTGPTFCFPTIIT